MLALSLQPEALTFAEKARVRSPPPHPPEGRHKACSGLRRFVVSCSSRPAYELLRLSHAITRGCVPQLELLSTRIFEASSVELPQQVFEALTRTAKGKAPPGRLEVHIGYIYWTLSNLHLQRIGRDLSRCSMVDDSDSFLKLFCEAGVNCPSGYNLQLRDVSVMAAKRLGSWPIAAVDNEPAKPRAGRKGGPQVLFHVYALRCANVFGDVRAFFLFVLLGMNMFQHGKVYTTLAVVDYGY